MSDLDTLESYIEAKEGIDNSTEMKQDTETY